MSNGKQSLIRISDEAKYALEQMAAKLRITQQEAASLAIVEKWEMIKDKD